MLVLSFLEGIAKVCQKVLKSIVFVYQFSDQCSVNYLNCSLQLYRVLLGTAVAARQSYSSCQNWDEAARFSASLSPLYAEFEADMHVDYDALSSGGELYSEANMTICWPRRKSLHHASSPAQDPGVIWRRL